MNHIIVFTAKAAYFEHVSINVTQPNGVQLSLFITGDEYYRRVYDANNYTVVMNPLTGYYVYAELSNDSLVPGNQVVGQKDKIPAGLVPGLDISARKKIEKRNAYWADVPPKVSLTDNPTASTTGTLNNLVVFIRFSDQTEFSTSLTTYDNMFNNSSSGYKAQSGASK